MRKVTIIILSLKLSSSRYSLTSLTCLNSSKLSSVSAVIKGSKVEVTLVSIRWVNSLPSTIEDWAVSKRLFVREWVNMKIEEKKKLMMIMMMIMIIKEKNLIRTISMLMYTNNINNITLTGLFLGVSWLPNRRYIYHYYCYC